MELPDFLSRKGRVEVDGYTDCWVWQKSGRPAPYRRIYEEMYGELGNAFDLHHKCKNPICVNPDHLEVVTPAEHGSRHLRGPRHPVWRH